MAASLSTHITVTVPVNLLEDQILKLNSEGFTVTKGEVIDKNIKLFATRIFIQRKDNDKHDDTRKSSGDY